MATAPSNNERLHLLGLPEDILGCLVDQLAVLDLKQLRLAHRRLSTLKHVLRKVFLIITMTPHAAHKGLDGIDIMPYVRGVTFKATPGTSEFADLTAEELRTNITMLPIEYKLFYLSGAAETAVVKILRQLPNLRMVKISVSDPPDGTLHVPPLKLLVPFASTCLMRAGVRIEEFTYVDCATPTLAYYDAQVSGPQDWTGIDLSNLKSFTFDIGGHRERGKFGRAPTSVFSTLHKAAARLERLTVCTGQVAFGIGRAPAPLGCLRRLRLVQCSLRLPEFASWLLQCPKLEELTLRHTTTTFENWIYDIAAWRPVFDALRRHPMRMKVVFDEVEVTFWDGTDPDNFNDEDDFRFSLDFHTAHGVQVDVGDDIGAKSDREVTRANDLRMVTNYMAGVGDWNLPPRFRREQRQH